MNTLIVYTTNRGSTETVATKMKEDLGENVVLLNLKQEPNPSIKEYQRIIIGGSILTGQIQKRVRTFCLRNLDELLKKEIGLFICCMEEGRAVKKQIMNTYPEELYIAAKSTAVFNSGIDFSRMNFLEKLITKKVKGLRYTSAKVDYEAVHKFSRRMDRVFNPFLFLA